MITTTFVVNGDLVTEIHLKNGDRVTVYDSGIFEYAIFNGRDADGSDHFSCSGGNLTSFFRLEEYERKT